MQDKKGFTLVEILAVVVILGIIMVISVPAVSKWISRGKAESKESQKSTLLMAAQSYAQDNKKVLPKAIGQTTILTAEELKNANYLKEDLYDADKKKCMNSVIRIYKYNKTGYTYTAYIYCEGDAVPNSINGVEPSISVGFSGSKKEDNAIHDVAISSFKVTIDGGSNGSVNYGIDGYSYSISVKYTDDINEQAVEIYNSGSLNGGGRENIIIEKSLSEYTDITRVNEFIVTVEAYNRDGGHKKVTASSIYRDTDAPICGKVTGEPAANSWLNTAGSTRTISVLCSDGDGSGCTKDKFVYTFDTEMKNGVITISDNAGNTTDCPVRVNIDWTRPTLTITPFIRTADGLNGASAGNAVTASHSTMNNTITLDTYTNLVGGWMNKANYPNGVYFEVEVKDNIAPAEGQWYHNETGIFNENASNINTMKQGAKKTFTAGDNKTNVYLSGEGMRRARYDFKDEAGNMVKIDINANIDKTNPSCSTSKSNLNTTAGVNVSVACSDYESKCSSSNTLSYSGVKQTSTYSVADNAGNRNSCSVTVYAQIQSRSRTCGTAKRCEDAGCEKSETKYYCYSNHADVCTSRGYTYGGTTGGHCRVVAGSGGGSDYSWGVQACDECVSYKRNYSTCGCETWDPWGAWGNSTSCTSGNTTDCRTIYY